MVEVVFEALGVMTVKVSHGVIRRERFVGFRGGEEGCGCWVGGGSLSFLRLRESFECPPPAATFCWSASMIMFMYVLQYQNLYL